MRKSLLSAAALLIGLSVCLNAAAGSSATIYEKKDDFSGKTLFFTNPQKPKLDGGSFMSERYVFFKIEAVSPIPAPEAAYIIVVDASLPDWLFIKSGGSLDLKLDGQILTLSGQGSASQREIVTNGISETAMYPISEETLKKIAAAHQIQFRLYGERGAITGLFTDKMLQDFQVFADKGPGLLGTAPPSTIAGTKP